MIIDVVFDDAPRSASNKYSTARPTPRRSARTATSRLSRP